MTNGIKALKQRLNERTKFAKAGEHAVGLIEDVERSISGAGILKPTVEFMDGAVVLRVVVEPGDVITCEKVTLEPTIIGIDMGCKEGDESVEFPVDMSEAKYGAPLGCGLAPAPMPLKTVSEDLTTPVQLKPIEGPKIGPTADLDAIAPLPEEQSVEANLLPLQPWGVGSVGEGELAQQEKLWSEGLTIVEIAKDMGIKTKRVRNNVTRFRERFPKRQQGAHMKKPAKSAPRVDTSRFTPALDLQLAQHMEAGDGIGTAAAIVRIPREICVARWNELMPKKTPKAIKALVKRLLDDSLAAQ